MEDYCQYQQRLIGTITPLGKSEHASGLLSSFFTFPGIGNVIRNALALNQEKRPLEALSLLIFELRYTRFWFNHTKKWWKLMALAMRIAQNLEPWTQKRFCEPLLRLLSLSDNAPQPWQGREVAYCFATLSLWSFQDGKTQKAVDKIQIAIHADPTWGYSEYLLGWYGLLLEGIEPIPHFVRAITIEGGLWQCFIQDPLLAHFPEIRLAVECELHLRPSHSVE